MAQYASKLPETLLDQLSEQSLARLEFGLLMWIATCRSSSQVQARMCKGHSSILGVTLDTLVVQRKT
jgi:hypothetical protein